MGVTIQYFICNYPGHPGQSNANWPWIVAESTETMAGVVWMKPRGEVIPTSPDDRVARAMIASAITGIKANKNFLLRFCVIRYLRKE
jgi:hypothetical protein